MKHDGFSFKIEFDLTFTGRDLYYLLRAAKGHYDAACRVTAIHAGHEGNPTCNNGAIIRLMFHLGQRCNDYMMGYGEPPASDEDFLIANLDAETQDITLSWDRVDLLTKVAEGFRAAIFDDEAVPFDADYADTLYASLRQCLRDGNLQYDILAEQEKLRRERFAEAQKQVLDVSAN